MVNALKHEDTHILLESADVQWYWDGNQIIRFRELWREGASVEEIAEELGSNSISIALLVMDQAEESNIRPRRLGLFGK
ncbi:helix-turn-helix domain containing protein [Sporosarcina sp. FSL W7-1283]|uniref:helix-turn-helix domain containing protein n=1 Tax=Sporosarcina sp. FSL W7-1283 TaxID=2921560 RepID=UPI0030FB0D54